MARVEVAIWHPDLSANDIVEKVGAPARIVSSVGEQRRPGSGVYAETYCRFDLGDLPCVKEAADLAPFERFRNLVSSIEFTNSRATWIAYFSVQDGESELYLDKSALTYLSQMGFGVVFRGD